MTRPKQCVEHLEKLQMYLHLDASIHQLACSLHVTCSSRRVRLVGDTKCKHSGHETGKVVHAVIISTTFLIRNICNRVWSVACAVEKQMVTVLVKAQYSGSRAIYCQ